MPSATFKVKCAMKALSLSGPGHLSLVDKDTPHPPAGHVLVEVHASAIQPSDIMNANGGFSSTTYPRIPGRDFSGVIASVGDGVQSSLIGTEIFGTSGKTHAFTEEGFQANYAVISEGEIVRKPEALSHTQAATIGVPISTAALILKHANLNKGEKVLVLGANGAVGSAVCALAGQNVIKAVRGSRGDVDTKADPLLESAGQVDVVIDAVGSPDLTEAAIDRLSLGGRIIIISAPKNQEVPKLTLKMKEFYRAERSLIGVNSAIKTSEEMASLLNGIDPNLLIQYASAGAKWTEISLAESISAYGDKTKGKKYVIKMI